MKDLKFYSLTSDTTFKYLFKNNKTRFFFNELVEYYTGINISNFTLLDNELSTGNNFVSYKLDTVLTNDDKSIFINIVMNKSYKPYVETRNRRYLHTIAGSSKNNKYEEKKIVIQVNLNCYSSHNDKDISKETYQLHDIENDIIIDDFIIHNIFIPKEVLLCYNEGIKKKLNLFLCNSYDELRNIIGDDKELKIIMNELERLNNEKFFGALYDAEEEQKRLESSARNEGFNEGFNEGIEQGEESKAREIAINMFEKNHDLEEIAEITGLSIDELEKLK